MATCLTGGLSIAHGAPAVEQTTGTPGSPNATTTIAGDRLPPPPEFGGKIERNAQQSTPWWPPLHQLSLRGSVFGKNHNTPAFQASPFDQWPTGMGFDYFYGFMGGDTNQWQPNLFRNTTAIYPYIGDPNFNLTTAEADDAISWMKRIDALHPEQPLWSISPLELSTHRTILPRSGSRRSATCTCSTRVGTNYAKLFSRIRKSLA